MPDIPIRAYLGPDKITCAASSRCSRRYAPPLRRTARLPQLSRTGRQVDEAVLLVDTAPPGQMYAERNTSSLGALAAIRWVRVGPSCRVAVATGARSGIGAGVARRFMRGGARVIAIGRDAERLERVVEPLGDRVVAVRCDVTDPGDYGRAVEVAVDRFGKLDVVVSNPVCTTRTSR